MGDQRKDLHRQLRQKGWRDHKTSKHRMWRCPCGQSQVVTSSTIGRGRATANEAAQFRRVTCGCAPT